MKHLFVVGIVSAIASAPISVYSQSLEEQYRHQKQVETAQKDYCQMLYDSARFYNIQGGDNINDDNLRDYHSFDPQNRIAVDFITKKVLNVWQTYKCDYAWYGGYLYKLIPAKSWAGRDRRTGKDTYIYTTTKCVYEKEGATTIKLVCYTQRVDRSVGREVWGIMMNKVNTPGYSYSQ